MLEAGECWEELQDVTMLIGISSEQNCQPRVQPGRVVNELKVVEQDLVGQSLARADEDVGGDLRF